MSTNALSIVADGVISLRGFLVVLIFGLVVLWWRPSSCGPRVAPTLVVVLYAVLAVPILDRQIWRLTQPPRSVERRRSTGGASPSWRESDRILLEARSTTTREEAVRRCFAPKASRPSAPVPGGTIERARLTRCLGPTAQGLARSNALFHETIGWMYYWWGGWI